MRYYFAWVRGTTDVHPQKWSGALTSDQRPAPHIFRVEITEEEFNKTSLDELAKRYPKPEVVE